MNPIRSILSNIDTFGITLIVGVLLCSIYLVVNRKSSKLNDAINIILCSGGVIAGLKLCYLAYFGVEFKAMDTSLKTYIFIGGMALIWVSVSSILGLLNNKAKV